MIKKTKKKIYNLLRWTQKYTKTDMVYLAKGSFWLNLGTGITSLAGLGLAIAFANLIPPETYGTFKFIISFSAILAIPTLSGMNQALVRAVAQGNEATFYPALKTKLKWGVLGALGALVLSAYYLFQDNTTLGLSFLLIAGFIPFKTSFNFYSYYLSGKKDFKHLSQYQAIARILVVISTVIALFLSQNLFLILLVYFAATTLFRLFFLLLTLKKYPTNQNQDPSSIGYGKHLSLMGVLGTVASHMDKILLFHFLGPIQLAIYTFSTRPIKVMKKPLESLTKISLPKLSQRNAFKLKNTLPGKMIKFFLMLLPLVGVYILLAPYFYQLFFPQYLDSIVYSQIFALSVLLYPGSLMGQTLTAHAKKKELYILRTSTAVLKIALFLILLPLWGVWGAITALLAAGVFGLLLNLLFFLKIKDNSKNQKEAE